MKKVLLPVLILFHVWLLTKVQFTAWPEMLSYPYLMTNGYSFYGDIIQPFVPLLPVLLTVWFSLFGLGVNQLFLLTSIVIVFSDLILYRILSSLFSKSLSYFLLSIFIVLVVGFEGNGMWFDLAVVPFTLCSFLFVIQCLSSKKDRYPFLAGMCLALAILIKLSSIFLLVSVIVLLLIYRKPLRYFFLGFLSTSVCILCLCFFFFHIGNGNDFLYWGIYYPLFIIGKMPGYLDFPAGKQILILLVLIFPSIFIFLQKRSKQTIVSGVFCFSLLLFAFHRFAYFHLQPIMPFFVISLGFLVSSIIKKRNIGIIVISGFLLIFTFYVSYRNISNQWGGDVRFADTSTIQLSQTLENNLPHNTKIFFYNTPSQYFVFAHIFPTIPWTDTFPWYLELPKMQENIVNDLQHDNQWVVFSDTTQGSAFALGSYKPKMIETYILSHYHKTIEVSQHIYIMQKNP